MPAEPETETAAQPAEATETTEATPADDAAADIEEATDPASAPDEGAESTTAPAGADGRRRRIRWTRVLAYGVLPGLALLLAMAAGFLKWADASVQEDEVARVESVQAAKDSTIAMLTYEAGTVEEQLRAAHDLLTGEFENSYMSLVNDVVIPGVKQQQISVTASVPAAASVSAEPNHAVVLVFVNQTAVDGKAPPTDTASSVRVTLDKIGGRWLISGFDPV